MPKRFHHTARDDRERSSPRPHPTRTAYVDGLAMLARRELSERQIRQRLARKGHEQDAIDQAVTRLKDARAINDQRVAEAIAHTELAVRGRGRLRVRRQIEQAGISASAAKQATDAVYQDTDEGALLAAAIDKRLRPGARIADDAEFRRLYRYLTSQGFESDRVVAALRQRRRSNPSDE